MNKIFYLIPINNEHTYLNDIKLLTMLRVTHPEIVRLEDRKEALYQCIDFGKIEYDLVVNKLDKLYATFGVPKYLIVVEKDGERRELVTNGIVTTDKEAEFESYEMPYNIVNEYYTNNFYNEKLSEYYGDFIYYKDNQLKSYQLEFKKENK